MPRQPFLQVVRGKLRFGNLDIGAGALGQRPELEKVIAHCVMAWPHVEIEMAMILGHLIGAKDDATLAVFHNLRRSMAQRDAIMEAAKIVLNPTDLELLSALLNVHKSVEAERNSLCHGHFGVSSEVTDGLVWMNTGDYVSVKSNFSLRPQTKPPKEEILSKLYVYKLTDLTAIFSDIKLLGEQWFEILEYFRSRGREPEHGGRYRQLCGQPRIAQELAILRQKNTR
jgi:hypothetical protein